MTRESNAHTLLIIDDNPRFAEDVKILAGDEFHVISAKSGEEGLRKFEKQPADLVLLDLKLGRGINGLETLQRLKQIDPEVPAIIVTEHASTETAFEAGQLGAVYYHDKTVNLKSLKPLIEQHLEKRQLQRAYQDGLERQHARMIGESKAMRELRAEIATVAPTEAPVLITGESGAGKELVALEIHRLSRRSHRPMLTLNCSNLQPTLFESEFFGHERGAFTGADKRQSGKLENANGSTLFLDEIADFPWESQPKILRALEQQSFQRLGGHQELRVNVRFILATNHDLEKAIREGRFRQELYFRINGIHVHVPPLRDKLEDVPLLANHYLQHYSQAQHKPAPEVPESVLAEWQHYHWPGNIRELTRVLERIVIYSDGGKVDPKHFQVEKKDFKPAPEFFDPFLYMTHEQAKEKLVAEFQQIYFKKLLERCGGSYSEAAKIAGVNRSTIYRILNSKEEGDEGLAS